VAATLRDWRTAPVDPRLRAMLGFLEKVTLHPGDVGPGDAAALGTAGVSRAAAADALYVCAYFNLIDRLADSLAFDLPSAEEHASYAPAFLEEGYGNDV
jgi:alkylhydroperoxidase family enzyme